MGDYGRGRSDFDDEDRLPWLEPAPEDIRDEGVSPLRLLGLVILGLAIVGGIVFGVWWLGNRGGIGGQGEGRLIAAPTQPFKLPAKEADAKKFEGEGDASYAASEGVSRDGHIDPSRVPEAPITGIRPAPEKTRPEAAAKPAASVRTSVADATDAKTAAPAARGPSSGTIQLGAYASESGAKDAWTKLSKRFAYLAPLAMAVEPATVGGSTVYRLRATAGGQASTVCGRLKVAGESCLLVN
ncbi:MAG: SPOR domain-containing protein [Sphingobium sp.]